MNFLIAIDSFKGSLSSLEAGLAVKKAAEKVYGDAKCMVLPLADGGEGTMEAIVYASKGEKVTALVSDPLGREINAQYGIINGDTAVIEMASAAGITLVSDEERNPLNTTTYGVGEMIADAIGRGCRKFIIGIGGSATNDGGTGMLSALGFKFLKSDGSEIEKGAKGLFELCEIKSENALKELSECTFTVACDVTNPLCGDVGCSRIYGPQKGATEEMILKMDKALANFALLTKNVNISSDENYPGSGAAGGMGFAFMSYLGGVLKSGIETVTDAINLSEYAKEADIVITGEGKLDSQSCMGKAPVGVANIAKKYGKKVIAFSGVCADDAGKLNEYGIDAFFPILRKVCTLDEALDRENASKNLENTAEQVFRLIKTMEAEK